MNKRFDVGSYVTVTENNFRGETISDKYKIISANKRLVVKNCDGKIRWFRIINNGFRVWAVLDKNDLDRELLPIDCENKSPGTDEIGYTA